MEDQKKHTRSLIDARPKVYFGVAWDLKTVNVLNAIVLDILSYKRVTSNAKLVVVCSEPKFLKRVCSAIQVDCVDVKGFGDRTPVWKLYYEKTCPDMPAFSQQVYEKKVSQGDWNLIKMTKNDPRYPSLFNYQDNVMVPPGLNPNVNKIPPRTHNMNQPSLILPYF